MKKVLSILLPLVIGGALGLGFALFVLIPQEFRLGQAVMILLSLLVFFVLHVVIHELGHLVFGKLTGYRFSSLRFFSWMLQKDAHGKYSVRKFSVLGTLGQCLMTPPEKQPLPYHWYLLGGGLANLLTSFLALLLWHTSPFAWVFSFIGIILGVNNLTPTGFNDGMSYRIAGSSPEQAYLLYLQLQVNSLTTRGTKYLELPTAYFEPVAEIPQRTYFNDWHTFLITSRTLFTGDWLAYREQLETLMQNYDHLLPMYQLELKKELLYSLCLTDPTDPRIQTFWQDKALQQSLKMPLIGNQRIKIAYTYAILNDFYAAKAMIREAADLVDQAPNRGDALSELELLAKLQQEFVAAGDVR